MVDINTLERSRGQDDGLDGLVGVHEVDKVGDRGMREKRKWCGAGYPVHACVNRGMWCVRVGSGDRAWIDVGR